MEEGSSASTPPNVEASPLSSPDVEESGKHVEENFLQQRSPNHFSRIYLSHMTQEFDKYHPQHYFFHTRLISTF